MHGDFTRLTFAPGKHFSSVLFQQGRVSLDADANEQSSILLHYMRTLASDLIGPFGGPVDDCGFRIGVQAVANKPPDLSIGTGRYYVAGIACENDDAKVRYLAQPDAYLDPDDEDDRLPDPPFVAYLRVCERQVTAVQDPSIREVALGMDGPDTATRSRVAWQVLATATTVPGSQEPVSATMSADALRQAWKGFESSRGARALPRLRARGRHPAETEIEPCIVSPDASYRGAENQLYRVEIHRVDPDRGASFKWSRENGSVTLPIVSMTGDEVLVTSLGRDTRYSIEAGDWIEVVDDAYAGLGRTEPLRRVRGVDRLDRRITLEPANGDVTSTGRRTNLHPFLRRWDQRAAGRGPSDLAHGVPVDTDAWQPLEDGVEVQFEAGDYQVGDYWLIPARTATGDVEWPGGSESPEFREPVGIVYHYAPLALVVGLNQAPIDLRCAFKTLECITPPPPPEA